MTDITPEVVERIDTLLDHRYTRDDQLLLDSELVRISIGDIRALRAALTEAEARTAAVVEGLELILKYLKASGPRRGERRLRKS